MSRPLRAEDLFYSLPHPVETIANLDAVPIRECGEPLIEVSPASGLRTVRPMRLRKGTDERLRLAGEAASKRGLTILLLDAYRHPTRQFLAHRIGRAVARTIHPTWSRSLVRELANKYVAAPDALAPAPHTTGGAIDLTLLDGSGRKLPMGRYARTDHEGIREDTRRHRNHLREILEPYGFSNYEEEWWHWSYGDSGWALRSGQPFAIYGKTV